MTKGKQDNLLVGAHCSAQGGVHKALLHGHSIGCTTIQLFTANQKTWRTKLITDDEVDRWFEALKETDIHEVMSHDSYLINLGSPDRELLKKSCAAFELELKRCHQLKISYLNFHPGAATTGTEEECLEAIIESLLSFAPLADKGPTRLLIETTAGQGTTVGWSFDHLDYIISAVSKKVPIGTCIDTCHIFAAGYDIRTKKAWDATIKEFDEIVGLKHLYGFHVNDSLKPFDSRKDRHANLGEGEIGNECFKSMMRDPRLRKLPKYLETPHGDTRWKDEIATLRKYAH